MHRESMVTGGRPIMAITFAPKTLNSRYIVVVTDTSRDHCAPFAGVSAVEDAAQFGPLVVQPGIRFIGNQRPAYIDQSVGTAQPA